MLEVKVHGGAAALRHAGRVSWSAPPPPRAWFRREVIEVARDLLGSYLVRSSPEGVVVVLITEVEAYRGSEDPASHAYRGRTARNATMFGDGGHLYVYRHMGLHACANIAADVEGVGHGVLLRAGEVVEGHELARRRRTEAGVCRTDLDLARGPARLTVAAGIGLELDGTDVGTAGGAVVVVLGEAVPESAVSRGPRVGVAGAGDLAAALPYRLWLAGDPHVSAFRA